MGEHFLPPRGRGEAEFFRQDLQDLQDSGTGKWEKWVTQRHGGTEGRGRVGEKHGSHKEHKGSKNGPESPWLRVSV